MIAESWNGYLWASYGFTALLMAVEVAAVYNCRSQMRQKELSKGFTETSQGSQI